MTTYLVELYAGGPRGRELSDRVAAAARQLRLEDEPVRLLRSILVEEDETCFLVLEAGSLDAARRVGERAGVEYGRVVVATELPGATTTSLQEASR